MNSVLRSFTTTSSMPLVLRREIARKLVPRDGSDFEIELSGKPYKGKLDNYIEWLVYVRGDYFEFSYLNLIKSLLDGGTALDIGGNVGNHTHAFAAHFDRVHSFEPFAKVAERLVEKASHFENATVHQIALSNENGELSFETPETENWGTGKISESGSIKVPVKIGDDFLVEENVGPVNFVKIDVEGHEISVIEGLQKTIHTDRPVVMFEVPRAWLKNGGEGLGALTPLFPEDYEFVGFRGQSSFPVQRQFAKVVPVDCRKPGSFSGKLSYLFAFGPERGFKVGSDGTITR